MENILLNVRRWYRKNYPTDKLGERINSKITFCDVLSAIKHNKPIYDVIGVSDSFIREMIFYKLSKITGISLNKIYKMWAK